MKTKEELNAFRNEVEALSAKLAELKEEEMEQIVGGDSDGFVWKKPEGLEQYEFHFYSIKRRKSIEHSITEINR